MSHTGTVKMSTDLFLCAIDAFCQEIKMNYIYIYGTLYMYYMADDIPYSNRTICICIIVVVVVINNNCVHGNCRMMS